MARSNSGARAAPKAAPSTAPYKVIFDWEKDGAHKGKLTAFSCEEENVPADETWKGKTLNLLAQVFTNEREKACLTVNKSNTLQIKKGRFLYMDVGCWLAGSQSFGLVCGEDAMVCEYKPGRAAGAGKNSGNALLDEFTRLPGVSVQFWEKIPPPHPTDPKRLCLILPDMHIAEAPPLDYPRPPDDPQQWNAFTGGSWAEDPRTWDEWAKRDLFDSRASIDAMIGFLSMVQGLGWAKQITLVQLGDMYELWAARDLFIKKSKDDTVHIIGNGVEEVGKWVGRTHLLFPYLFHAFDQCASRKMEMMFLHGNHDDYLSRPEVIAAANAYVQTGMSPYGETRDRGPSTTVHPRRENIAQDSVFIEHGQRCDQYNRDGETSGYEKANTAVNQGWTKHVVDLKSIESTRRPTFVGGAAAMWCLRQGDFGLYVMGHTHKADLHQVEVTHRLEERVYSPVGVMIVDEGPLDGVSR